MSDAETAEFVPVTTGDWIMPAPPCPAFRYTFPRGAPFDIERCALPEHHDGDHSPTRPDNPED